MCVCVCVCVFVCLCVCVCVCVCAPRDLLAAGPNRRAFSSFPQTYRVWVAIYMKRRIHSCHMRRRIHACHMRRIHVRRFFSISSITDNVWVAFQQPPWCQCLSTIVLGTLTCILLLIVAFQSPQKSVPWYYSTKYLTRYFVSLTGILLLIVL